jgi:inner membrane protein
MEGLIVQWWMWFLFGMLLLLLEFLTPGAFYQFFFGVGGIVVGLIVAVWPGMPLGAQLGVFLILSLGSLAVLRKPLQKRFGKDSEDNVDKLPGETAVAMEDIAVDGLGKAELRGSVWNARNVGAAPIEESQRCRVESRDGLTISIKG